MGKKPIVCVTYENERISIKNSVRYLKCVLRLFCVVNGPIYGHFMGFYVNGFLSMLRFTKPGTPATDPPKENSWKFAPTAPIASNFRLGNTR